MSIADDILSCFNPDDRRPVRCQALAGKDLFLKPASAADIDHYAAALRGDRYGGSPATAIACRLLVDGAGKRVFADTDPDAVADRLSSRIGGELLEQAIDDGLLGRDVETAEKN